MLSKKIETNTVKIRALFDLYDDLSKTNINDPSDYENHKLKMAYARRQIIGLTGNIKKIVKNFEENL